MTPPTVSKGRRGRSEVRPHCLRYIVSEQTDVGGVLGAHLFEHGALLDFAVTLGRRPGLIERIRVVYPDLRFKHATVIGEPITLDNVQFLRMRSTVVVQERAGIQ